MGIDGPITSFSFPEYGTSEYFPAATLIPSNLLKEMSPPLFDTNEKQ